MPSVSDTALWSALSGSAMFSDYQKIFEKATGLPLGLHPPGDHYAMERPVGEGPFCALMARTSRACDACFKLQKRLEEEANQQPKTLRCFAGLCETAVPVRVGDRLVAFLKTGQILDESPSRWQFKEITRELLRLGTHIDLRQFEAAYFESRVLTPDQYDLTVRQLAIFARILAASGNQLVQLRTAPDNTVVSRARQIIDEGFREDLSLCDVARRVNMSAGYFSTLFKRATGLNFLDYVARLRVEKTKNLLRNPRFRVSEVAFEVGFQSISQFNRTFHRIAGSSPRAYRAALGAG